MTAGVLTWEGIVFVSLYLVGLVFIGVAGHFAKKEKSLADFYLASRSLGLTVLLLTLYASQYSGNTLIGFSGQAYRDGYRFLVSVTFMMSILGAYFIYAPKLYARSQLKHYITPGDYLNDRFASKALTLVASLIFIIALSNYILSNLKAIGYIVERSTGGEISFAQGIIALSLIMVVYETLGGMRSVAWTDALQGGLLLLGCFVIFVAMQVEYGGLINLADTLREQHPHIWAAPSWEQKIRWLSTLVIVFLGISIYPHSIQRIFAAASAQTLKRSFQIMVFMPLLTTFLMVMVGLMGLALFPGLDRVGSEEITLRLINDLAGRMPAIQYLLVIFIAAGLAAIMSTVDSALLSISSILTQDIYRPLKPNASPTHLVHIGKVFSWLLMAGLVYLAISWEKTIWQLVKIKLEILIQVAPAIFLGLHLPKLTAKPVLLGMLCGVCVSVLLLLTVSHPYGIHAGVWGLMVNGMVLGLSQIRQGSSKIRRLA